MEVLGALEVLVVLGLFDVGISIPTDIRVGLGWVGLVKQGRG